MTGIPPHIATCDCYRLDSIIRDGTRYSMYGVLLPVSERFDGVFPVAAKGSRIILKRFGESHLFDPPTIFPDRGVADDRRVDIAYMGHVADMDESVRRGFAARFDDANLLFVDMVGAPIPANAWEPDERAVFGLDDEEA